MVTNNKCNLCGSEASQKCAGCLSVVYCSKDHQRSDWKRHKEECCCYKVEEDKSLGRCLVAKRDIKPGEVVLREKPLISGPSQVTGPVCLGCHNGLPGPAVSCDRCGWPMCSIACAQSPNHRPECQWAIQKRKEKVKITNFTSPHPTYACITALRVLHAKQTDPKLWSKISTLESHDKERTRDGLWELERFSVAKLLRRFYRLEEEITEEEILRICGIIQINCHEVPLSEPVHVSIYWKCSLLEHNCRANCSKSFTDKGEIVIRATEVIPAGQHISISYTDPLWGTPSRLHHLKHSKYFSCACQRCKDTTEFGTYFSALACDKSGCNGKLLPSTFSDGDSHWTCNNCGSSMPMNTVSELLAVEGERLSKVDKTSPSSCKTYLEVKGALTENHYHRVEVKLALAQVIGNREKGRMPTVSDEWLSVKESLCRELLTLSSILFPGECRLRGVLNFELHAAVAERAARDAAARREEDSVQTTLLESRKYLENALELLKYEPESLPEGGILKQAKVNIEELDRLLRCMHVSSINTL